MARKRSLEVTRTEGTIRIGKIVFSLRDDRSDAILDRQIFVRKV